MSDDQPRKHFVGTRGRRLTYDQALELGRKLFDAIEADRLDQSLNEPIESIRDDDQPGVVDTPTTEDQE
jgi:hypothetical protein